MLDGRSTRRPSPRLLVVVAIGLVVVAVGGWLVVRSGAAAQTDQTTTAADKPITRSEAEALLEQTVALARAGKYERLCATITDEERSCRRLLARARAAGHTPDDEAPTVHGTSRADRSLILHLQGQRPDDGKLYGADFAVTRDDTGRSVAYTPVYWSGVTINAEAVTSCSQRQQTEGSSIEASCGTEALPPTRRSR